MPSSAHLHLPEGREQQTCPPSAELHLNTFLPGFAAPLPLTGFVLATLQRSKDKFGLLWTTEKERRTAWEGDATPISSFWRRHGLFKHFSSSHMQPFGNNIFTGTLANRAGDIMLLDRLKHSKVQDPQKLSQSISLQSLKGWCKLLQI